MLLTRECDYGVRVIRALADKTKKTVDTIAAEELIPKKYAYKIIKKLERAKFVKSIRGRNGGYIISKPLDTFSLLDVVVAVDANRHVNECIRDDSVCQFKDHPTRSCTVHGELVRVQQLIEDELRSTSMAEILARKPS